MELFFVFVEVRAGTRPAAAGLQTPAYHLRYGRESNPRIEDLQSPALPLGYMAVPTLLAQK